MFMRQELWADRENRVPVKLTRTFWKKSGIMILNLSGRTGKEYNQRKNRKGAFWEDRYHATAVKTGNQLVRYAAYIDLNMVRT